MTRTGDAGAPLDGARPLAVVPTRRRSRWTRLVNALRANVRARESGLIFLSVVVGIAAGLLTVALSRSAALLHGLLFGLGGPGSLSALDALASPWMAMVPIGGGLALGIASRIVPRLRRRRPIDPIEANALHGGRMSILDSLLIGAQTLLSNGCGASVGLEAGYTQLGSGFASWLGRSVNLRRSDMRMMVGAGSAGAIGAAFGAPLTGAFYAFELIIGTYTPFGLAPVIAASISGVLVARALGHRRELHRPSRLELHAERPEHGGAHPPVARLRRARHCRHARRHPGRRAVQAEPAAARAAACGRRHRPRCDGAADAARSLLRPRRARRPPARRGARDLVPRAHLAPQVARLGHLDRQRLSRWPVSSPRSISAACSASSTAPSSSSPCRACRSTARPAP